VDLTEVPAALAGILAPANDLEPLVYTSLVDAIDVPCFMILWDEPWLETVQACAGFAFPLVIMVAGRVEPGDSLTVLAKMFAQLMTRTRADSRGWGIRAGNPGSPRVMEVGGVQYLAARCGLRVGVTIAAPEWEKEPEQ
jgi:hypothetical protein